MDYYLPNNFAFQRLWFYVPENPNFPIQHRKQLANQPPTTSQKSIQTTKNQYDSCFIFLFLSQWILAHWLHLYWGVLLAFFPDTPWESELDLINNRFTTLFSPIISTVMIIETSFSKVTALFYIFFFFWRERRGVIINYLMLL